MRNMDVSTPAAELARHLDTSIIKPDVTPRDVKNFLLQTSQYPFAGIAVDLAYTELAANILHGTGIDVVTTIAYPLGGLTTDVKLKHIEMALEKGTDEVDVSMNIGAFKSGAYEAVEQEIAKIVKLAAGNIVKIVIYCARLTDEEILEACKIARNAGADFVKTNPGFGNNTELRHVQLIREHFSNDELKVMPAGGIRTRQQALDFLAAGADRVATSYPYHVLGVMRPS